MADFCTDCSKELFGEDITPEIDVEKIFNELKPGYYKPAFLCEGCTLTAIMKTEEGEMKVAYLNENKQGNAVWSKYPKIKTENEE